VFYGANTALLGGDEMQNVIDASEPSTPSISYCDIEGGCEAITDAICGDGNLDTDPPFVDAASGDLHLSEGSPCIDVGNTYDLPVDTADLDDDGDLTEDIPPALDGNPRVVGAAVDMGAYEFWP
jgi:hypothetical protein